MRRSALVPYVCAAANAAAAVALATVLAPGVSLAPTPARATYVAEHLVAWRLGWGLWIVAALSLLAFFRWWGSRISQIGWSPVTRAAIVVAVIGVLADIGAESQLIAWSPGQPSSLDGPLRVSGLVANGLYSVAGLLLTARTAGLPRWLGAWSWAVWLLGIGLAGAAARSSDDASRMLTAALFILFLPWVVAIGRRLS